MTRKVACLAATLLLFAACGGNEADDPGLVGKWYAEDDGGLDCGYGFVFYDNGKFERDFFCALEGGGYGLESYVGTYELVDDDLTLTVTHSTCSDAEAAVYDARVDIDGDSLQLTSSTGIELYERLDESDDGDPTTGTVEFGCYAADGSGAFAPGELVEL